MAKQQTIPKMLLSSVMDPKDELEEQFMRSYSYVKDLISGLSDREINDTLVKQTQGGHQEDIQMGLLYGILIETQPGLDQTYYQHMTAVSRDASASVALRIGILTYEKWTKLTDVSQSKLLWVFRQMVKSSIIGIEPAGHHLLRQIAGGDVTPRNIALAENLLDIYSENREWVDKVPFMNGMAVYTYLRIIADHLEPQFTALRKKEVDYCMYLMTHKWNDCMLVGRDLVRVLQAVSRIPEFEQLWKKILHDPKSLSPTFIGLEQLMGIKTPRKFLNLRLTPDMENKMVFLTTKVKFGHHKRYQDWFQRQYLSTPESQSLRNDLIRFICVVIHPSNDMLQSDIIPRWAVIGWLLTTCTSNVAATNAKLALFWDWLFYDKEKDNIMNIEPGILVMQHSLKPHLAITVTLLDFLCRIIPNFYPPLKMAARAGVHAALGAIVDKRVMPSLSPLFDSARLDRELRVLIRESFPEFCNSAEVVRKSDPPTPTHDHPPDMLSRPPSPCSDGAYSDEEDSHMKKSNAIFKPIEAPRVPRRPVVKTLESFDSHVEQTSGELRNLLLQLKAESDDERRCEITEKLIQHIVEIEGFDEIVTSVAAALCILFQSTFDNTRLPGEVNDEFLEDSIVAPLFVIFRNICSLPMDEPTREDLTFLLYEMHSCQPRLGYLLLYFLKVGKTSDEKMQTYKGMANFASDEKDLKTFILEDMKLCQEADMQMFIFLLPDVYQFFPSGTVNNPDLMLLICSTIDGAQLLELVCQILQGHLILFRRDSVLAVLNHSLDWETIEQYFMWQLLISHDIPAEHICPILPKLEFNKHAEAITSLLGLLKQKSPSNDLVRLVLCREAASNDLLTISILKHWATEDEEKMAECLAHFLTHLTGTPRKKQQKTKKEMPTIDNILAHLENMRHTCKNISFLTNETIQQALQQVQQSSTESQKQRYGELFALIMDDESEEELPSKRNLRQTAARRANNASPKHIIERRKRQSDTSEESDEDVDLRPQPAKKRKKGMVLEIEDSD